MALSSLFSQRLDRVAFLASFQHPVPPGVDPEREEDRDDNHRPFREDSSPRDAASVLKSHADNVLAWSP